MKVLRFERFFANFDGHRLLRPLPCKMAIFMILLDVWRVPKRDFDDPYDVFGRFCLLPAGGPKSPKIDFCDPYYAKCSFLRGATDELDAFGD